jgi:two-component system, OmpR family, response regulator ChvI
LISSKGNPNKDESVPFYFNNPSEEISFSGHSQNYCVCFVDMVDSTKITAQIADAGKIRKYYSIFINTMAVIARDFDAKIIKNTGDCLIYYFPKTSDSANNSAFKAVLECGITSIAASDVINAKLMEEGGLPPLYYRISADYGRVEIAKSITSQTDDLFGSTVNLCAKINSKAAPNGMVIGGDLYQIVNKSYFDDHYHFQELDGYSIVDFKHKYPIYSVESKNKNIINPLNHGRQVSEIELTQLQPHLTTKQVIKSHTDEQQKYLPNIMIVDDEPDALLTYKTFLATEDYNVDAFTDPQQALKCFATKKPSYYNLVVMDIRMPGLNGLQLYYRLKAMNMSVKILFVSALDAARELISILPDINHRDIIKKPIDEEHFVSAVRTILGPFL